MEQHEKPFEGGACFAGGPSAQLAALCPTGKGQDDIKREIVVKTEPEDESCAGTPLGLGLTIPRVPCTGVKAEAVVKSEPEEEGPGSSCPGSRWVDVPLNSAAGDTKPKLIVKVEPEEEEPCPQGAGDLGDPSHHVGTGGGEWWPKEELEEMKPEKPEAAEVAGSWQVAPGGSLVPHISQCTVRHVCGAVAEPQHSLGGSQGLCLEKVMVPELPAGSAGQKPSVASAETPRRPFSCSECGKSFQHRASLVIHLRVHTGERPFGCAVCGKSFNCRKNLVIHQRIHTGEKPFACTDCGKSFNRKSNLASHRRIHASERPFACTDCGKSFSHKSNLNKHRRIHMDEMPFACADCGKSFKYKDSLVAHQRTHTGERPFACADCGKTFKVNATLAKHRRIHTGERPYVCADCGKTFNLKATLDNHHRRIHTSEWPFACPECGKSFKVKGDLQTHHRNHLAAAAPCRRPCADCGRVFAHREELTEHRQLHGRSVPGEGGSSGSSCPTSASSCPPGPSTSRGGQWGDPPGPPVAVMILLLPLLGTWVRIQQTPAPPAAPCPHS